MPTELSLTLVVGQPIPIAVGSATSHSQQPQMIKSLAALAIFGLGSSCRCLARLCSSGGGERNRRLG